jgi:ABC-type transport system substrate-binding protein
VAASKLAKASKLNFKLELNCSCKPPICSHAGPGIAKLLEAAYAKGRSDGMQEAVQGIAKAAAKIGVKVEVQHTPAGVRQAGSKRTQ